MTKVALVVLDTLRKDAFDSHFDWLPGVRFENAWSTSHWTAPAHASLFTGLYPEEHGVNAKSPVFSYSNTTLIERLSDNDISTRAFSTNAYASPSFNFDRGFDEFTGDYRMRCRAGLTFDWYSLINEQDGGISRYLAGLWGCIRSDNTIESLKNGLLIKANEEGIWSPTDSGISEAIPWAGSTSFDNDEFAFINLMEAHSPYLGLPDEYLPQFEGDVIPKNPTVEHVFRDVDNELLREAYDSAVEYLSDRYRVLFDELIECFDCVITVSDHGELLGENGYYGHNYGLFPELTHVPIVISTGEDNRDEVKELVSLLDVHATILDLFDNDQSHSRGRSLIADERKEPDAYLTQSFGLQTRFLERIDNSLNIARFDTPLNGVATPECYGFESVDRGWIQEEPDADLRTEMCSIMSNIDRHPDHAEGNSEMDEGTRQHLKELGYV
jgi:arylsulfatase A-like enzyme